VSVFLFYPQVVEFVPRAAAGRTAFHAVSRTRGPHPRRPGALMARVVLDASGAVHLVLNGPHAAYLAAKLEEAAIVTTPDLFCCEVANTLRKYVQVGELALDQAVTRLEECMELADDLILDRALAPEALVSAARHQHSVYDMMYAVLARRSGATVITMDRPFALRLRDMEIEVFCPLLKT
jgi:predicted nucleic acid-binding protein